MSWMRYTLAVVSRGAKELERGSSNDGMIQAEYEAAHESSGIQVLIHMDSNRQNTKTYPKTR
jgi:hypothetical protein